MSADVASRALDAGFIVNPVTPTALRLAPPLILTREQVDDFVAFLEGLPAELALPTDPADLTTEA